MLWFKVPPRIYFKRGATDLALRELKGKKRAFIVTNSFLFNSGAVDKITKILKEIDCEYLIFFNAKPDPDLSLIQQAMSMLKPFEPDVIIALGGGSPIDAAKIMWLMYEQPETELQDVAVEFMNIKKRISSILDLGRKATLVAIPTTSGTGSEVTPFSFYTDDTTGTKYAIADYALTPDMAIIDPNFVDNMPKGLTAAAGVDALVHAVEAYVSPMATNFINSNALEAIKQIFRYLERSYNEGAKDPLAREKMHYASTIAGMALANSFLGLCHSMAHKLSITFDIPHGVANALLIKQIIKFNANDSGEKQTKYAQIANELKLGGNSDKEKVDLLIKAIDNLMNAVDVPKSIKEKGVDKEDFETKLDKMIQLVIDDQCTGSTYPLAENLKQIYLNAYEGIV